MDPFALSPEVQQELVTGVLRRLDMIAWSWAAIAGALTLRIGARPLADIILAIRGIRRTGK